MKVYSVFDSKVGAYARPFYQRSAGEALRSWETIANDEKSDICRFPADFTLFEIAEFDEVTGKFTSHQAFSNLGTALSVKRQPAEQVPMFSSSTPVRSA